MTDKMREEFEKWHMERYGGFGLGRSTEPGYTDEYERVGTNLQWTAWQAARTVPEGWRIDRCSDGSINVIRYGAGGANVEQNAKQARHIPEEVLWMLANDMLSAAPEGKK